MTAGQKLYRWRVRLGFSQTEAAEIADICQSSWANYELDQMQPRVDQLVVIKAITHGEVDVADFAHPNISSRVREALDRLEMVKARAAARRGRTPQTEGVRIKRSKRSTTAKSAA